VKGVAVIYNFVILSHLLLFLPMPRFEVPKNLGKVRVVMALGNKYAVWNGKDGKNQFLITTRTKKAALEIARQINQKDHAGTIDVID
jgi:hypothetical protein